MNSKIYLDFVLWDTTIIPKEITKLLNVIPNTELLKGERNQKLNLPRANIWSLTTTPKPLSSSLETHWKELEAKLYELQNDIKNILIKGGEMRMIIVLSLEDNVGIPPLMIPPKMSEFISTFDIELEISIY